MVAATPERTFHHGQKRLILDRDFGDHVVLAGVGYGKTWVGPPWSVDRVIANPKSLESLVIAPTYKLLRRCFKEYVKYLLYLGMVPGKGGDFVFNKSDPSITYTHNNHTVQGVSAENPDRLISYTTSHIWCDESALFEDEIIRRCYQRNRCPDAAIRRQILHTTTPEGTNHMYERFGPDKCNRIEGTPYSEGKGKLVLHGRSHDNPYLDEEYLQTIESEFGWDSLYYSNYVLGEWVSLSRNAFYFKFSLEAVGDYPLKTDHPFMYLTWDSNVDLMTWLVFQRHGKDYHVCSENGSTGRNIQDACQQFIQAYPPARFKDWTIVVLGDASLHKRSDQTYTTGYDVMMSILKPLYPLMTLKAHRDNPFVEERSRCTNHLFSTNSLKIDKSCRKLIMSAKTAESDGKGKIKKPAGEKVTHPMEALDMGLIVLEPPQVRFTPKGISY